MVAANVLASVAPTLLPLARSLVGPTDAEDLVQDAVLEFCRIQPRRDEPGPVRAWLVKRIKSLAQDRDWDRSHQPETFSYEALGGE